MQILFRKEDGLLHVPDQATFMIWQALQAGFSVTELDTALQAEVAADGCKRDVAALYTEWQAAGMLSQSLPEPHRDHHGYSLIIQPALDKLSVVTNRKDICDYLQQHFPAASSVGNDIGAYVSLLYAADEQVYHLWHDGKLFATCASFDNAVISTLFLIGEIATHEEPRWLVCHAAAVIDPQQHTLLMPARAGSGKSTLTANLLQQGYHLINDDIVPLNMDGTITSISQTLKLKSGSWDLLMESYPALAELPALLREDGQLVKHLPVTDKSRCAAGSRHRVDYLVIPEYQAAAPVAHLQSLDQTGKLQYLLGAVPFFPHPLTRPYLQRILSWLAVIPAYKITYNNSEDALATLASLSVGHDHQQPLTGVS